MDGVPTPEEDLAWRLANVENRLEGISERLGRLESSVRGAVAAEVQGATAELRRAMSELGRRLVQDLPHELARHRDAIVDAIVAELRPAAPPPAPAPATPDLESELALPADPPAAAVAPMAADDAVPAPGEPEAAGRPRAHRLRRRQG